VFISKLISAVRGRTGVWGDLSTDEGEDADVDPKGTWKCSVTGGIQLHMMRLNYSIT